ncbi:MAG: D-amino acid aminotransferase [Dethiobacteria bacterium]|jgi:D-alanine transaminase
MGGKTGENVFLNGEFTDFSQAVISINDRGFLFGDGVYEFVACYYGKIFQLQEHLARLERSAEALEIKIPYTREQLSSYAAELLHRSGLERAGLYIQVTRGIAPRIHHFPKSATPTVLMTVRELPTNPQEVYSRGVKVLLVPDERWANCYIKTLNLVPNILAKEKAVRAGAFEAVFEHPQLGITEANSSNVFAVFEGKLVTAPLEGRILGGITRATVLQLARQEGLTIAERYMTREELLGAEEAFLTNTPDGVVPIRAIVDGPEIGNGRPGLITKLIRERYLELVESLK